MGAFREQLRNLERRLDESRHVLRQWLQNGDALGEGILKGRVEVQVGF